jgi:serine protease Do
VIIRVDDSDIPHAADLPRTIARHAPGSKVKVTVVREREERSFDVALDELKDEVAAERHPGEPAHSSPSPLGIALTDSQEGVVVQDVQSGGAADGDLERGDIVLEVNQTAVKSAAEAANRIEKTPAGSPILFKVKRNGRTHFAAIERHAADR